MIANRLPHASGVVDNPYAPREKFERLPVYRRDGLQR